MISPHRRPILLKLAGFLAAASLASRAHAFDLEAAPFSEDAASLYADASAVVAAEGTEVTVLDEEENFAYTPTGGYVHRQYLVYKVLTQHGVDGWSESSANWQPWRDDQPIIHARVVRADGTAYLLDQKAITDTPSGGDQSDVYGDDRIVRAPLPAMAPGAVVEEEIITTSRTLFAGAGDGARFYFGRYGVPVQHCRLTLTSPLDLPLHYALQRLPSMQPRITDSDGQRKTVFESGRIEPLELAEPHLPPEANPYPVIDFSSAASWREIADRYAAILETRIAAGDVTALAHRLVANKPERSERLAAILDYLDRDVRYTGVEFGEAAIIPRAPSEVLASKYGDCKDKATLLVALLRAVNIPAQVALLNVGATRDLVPDLPTADFFDHAIVYIPGEPALWIDATAQFTRLGVLPDSDHGRWALIVGSDSDLLLQTPPAASSDNLILEERNIDLADFGPARVVEIARPQGSFESLYREVYVDAKNKDNRKSLTDYVRTEYLAESLDRMETSSPTDLSVPFEMQLESKKARRGMTDLDIAVAVIRVASLFESLPDDLKKRQDTSKDADGTPAKKRQSDYLLSRPFRSEWQYRIVPPRGFQPEALPKDLAVSLGPATLNETFTADSDGVVHASLRFDTVKSRLTAAEFVEMRNAVADASTAQPIVIGFQSTGKALLDRDRASEAFAAYRDAIAQHPKAAVPHLRMAQALLGGGLGVAARREARLAAKLDPKSAYVQAGLAHVLEYDLVGRQWRPGSDLAGAAAALRSAEKLDPDNIHYRGRLALLLERDPDGVRYGRGADLAGALAEYQKLSPAELDELGLKENPAFALFYAGRFDDAQKSLIALNPPPTALDVACEAVLKGVEAAKVMAASADSADEDRVKGTLRNAGDILKSARQYPLAADLLEAGATGEEAIATLDTADLLRRAHRHEDTVPGNTPDGVVLKLFAATLGIPASDASVASLLSRRGREFDNGTDEKMLGQPSVAPSRNSMSRLGVSADRTLDVLAPMLSPAVDGRDAVGYRLVMQLTGGGSETFFVVKEDQQYRLLAASDNLAPLGLEVLDRLGAGDAAGARTLLDWARDLQHIGGGDDPYAGKAFPRLWTAGQDVDPNAMTLAAASLLVQDKRTAAQGLGLLEQADLSAPGADSHYGIRMALLEGYQILYKLDRELTVARELSESHPESPSAFRCQVFALLGMSKFSEVATLSIERLQRLPNDRAAIFSLASRYSAEQDYADANGTLQKLIDSGKPDAAAYNEMAWNSLFYDRPGGPDLHSAIRAAQLAKNNIGNLQTLASLYAEIGKTNEARDVLIRAMDLGDLEEPSSDFWYVLGRLAEQYGERDLAIDSYARVRAPELAIELPQSPYRLAQDRTRALRRLPR